MSTATHQNINYSIEFFVLVTILSIRRKQLRLKKYIDYLTYPIEKHGIDCMCPNCDIHIDTLVRYYNTWARIK